MISLATPVPSPAISEEASQWLAQGVESFNNEQLFDAKRAFNSVLQAHPDELQAQIMAGLTEHKLGSLSGAKQHLEKALKQDPDNATVIDMLAGVYFELHDFHSAKPLFEKITERDPEQDIAQYRLSIIYHQAGNMEHAIRRLMHILDRHPTNETYWTALSDICIKNRTFVPFPELETFLIKTLAAECVISDKALIIASILIANAEPCCHLPITQFTQAEISGYNPDWFNASMLPYLNSQLLQQIITHAFVRSIGFEYLLTGLRRFLLKHHHDLHALGAQHPFLADMMSALAIHSMLSDYAHFVEEDEKDLLESLWNTINSKPDFTENDTPTLALLGSYRPLYKLETAQNVLDCFPNHASPLFASLLATQIAEPLEEFGIMETIPALQEIKDEVSQKVAAQYMEHPYPRWKYHHQREVVEVSDLLLHTYPWLKDYNPTFPTDRPLEVLVAGCGTGQQALDCAMAYKNAHITAIDITKASLGYAIRKTRELGITSIDYLQADILDLDCMDKQFDMVECGGVLHHMRDPVEGWRKINARLRPGGIMRVAVYSELARRFIVSAREKIQTLDYASNDEGIRAFRRHIFELPAHSPLKQVAMIRDFYNLAECRDLLFHVQEHRFAIPQLKDILSELNLSFIGFSHGNAQKIAAFKRRFPNTDALSSLDAWHQFEQENPNTFLDMYQMTLHKPHE